MAEAERSRPARPPAPITRASPSTSVTSNQNTTTNIFHAFRQIYDQCYSLVNSALQFDEIGKVDEALKTYNDALRVVKEALETVLPENHDRRDEFVTMQQKLTKTMMQIESRISSLQPVDNTAGIEESHPPSYEEATDLTVGDEIMNHDIVSSSSTIPENAQEVFCLEEGVQIYFITAEGYVSAPSYPSALRVYKFTDGQDDVRPPQFLQIGLWYYPLVPGLSPVLHADNGSYMFPDTTSPESGCSVGLILPETISPEQRDEFDQILRSATVMHQEASVLPSTSQRQEQAMAEPRERTVPVIDEKSEIPDVDTSEVSVRTTPSEGRMSEKISHGIMTAADYVSRGVSFGAEKAGQLIKMGSNKIQTNLKQKGSATVIPEKYQNGLQKARAVSHVAVSVSAFVVKGLGEATLYLGRQVAPHVRKHGEKIIPRSWSKDNGSGHSKIDNVIEVAGSSLAGFGTIYQSLEGAAKVLGRSIANETVVVVSHRYGTDAGKLAENSLYSAGNILMTGHNAQHLGIKAVAKRAAKDAGKAVLLDYQDSRTKVKGAEGGEPSGKDDIDSKKGGDKT